MERNASEQEIKKAETTKHLSAAGWSVPGFASTGSGRSGEDCWEVDSRWSMLNCWEWLSVPGNVKSIKLQSWHVADARTRDVQLVKNADS